jgi:hypothetical protein
VLSNDFRCFIEKWRKELWLNQIGKAKKKTSVVQFLTGSREIPAPANPTIRGRARTESACIGLSRLHGISIHEAG